jgi:aspartate aminotransferase
MRTNDAIRRFLLHRAGVAVVPFQAFDLDGDDGWFRMSIGAVSPEQLRAALERLATALSG